MSSVRAEETASRSLREEILDMQEILKEASISTRDNESWNAESFMDGRFQYIPKPDSFKDSLMQASSEDDETVPPMDEDSFIARLISTTKSICNIGSSKQYVPEDSSTEEPPRQALKAPPKTLDLNDHPKIPNHEEEKPDEQVSSDVFPDTQVSSDESPIQDPQEQAELSSGDDKNHIDETSWEPGLDKSQERNELLKQRLAENRNSPTTWKNPKSETHPVVVFQSTKVPTEEPEESKTPKKTENVNPNTPTNVAETEITLTAEELKGDILGSGSTGVEKEDGKPSPTSTIESSGSMKNAKSTVTTTTPDSGWSSVGQVNKWNAELQRGLDTSLTDDGTASTKPLEDTNKIPHTPQATTFVHAAQVDSIEASQGTDGFTDVGRRLNKRKKKKKKGSMSFNFCDVMSPSSYKQESSSGETSPESAKLDKSANRYDSLKEDETAKLDKPVNRYDSLKEDETDFQKADLK